MDVRSLNGSNMALHGALPFARFPSFPRVGAPLPYPTFSRSQAISPVPPSTLPRAHRRIPGSIYLRRTLGLRQCTNVTCCGGTPVSSRLFQCQTLELWSKVRQMV